MLMKFDRLRSTGGETPPLQKTKLKSTDKKKGVKNGFEQALF